MKEIQELRQMIESPDTQSKWRALNLLDEIERQIIELSNKESMAFMAGLNAEKSESKNAAKYYYMLKQLGVDPDAHTETYTPARMKYVMRNKNR